MNAVLITGADGHLGRAVAEWFLATTDRPLWLWVRARDGAARQRKETVLASLLAGRRCRLLTGDLTDTTPFDGVDPAGVGIIIHSAAVTQFSVEAPLADRVNVDGTRRLLEFALRCPQLERFVLISTIYAAGLRTGRVPETPLGRAEEFANHYERSKWAAEELLTGDFAELPWQIQRLATILCGASGRVEQYNVIHNTLRLLYYGLLSVVPGQPGTRVYTTTTEFAAEVCGRLATAAGAGRAVFHLSEDGDQALSLKSLLDLVYSAFLRDAEFERLRILKPLICDWQAFQTLVDGARQFSGVMSQSLSSIAPFARQLYRDKHVETTRLRAALPDLAVPRAAELLPLVCDQLVSTRWGRRPVRAAVQ